MSKSHVQYMSRDVSRTGNRTSLIETKEGASGIVFALGHSVSRNTMTMLAISRNAGRPVAARQAVSTGALGRLPSQPIVRVSPIGEWLIVVKVFPVAVQPVSRFVARVQHAVWSATTPRLPRLPKRRRPSAITRPFELDRDKPLRWRCLSSSALPTSTGSRFLTTASTLCRSNAHCSSRRPRISRDGSMIPPRDVRSWIEIDRTLLASFAAPLVVFGRRTPRAGSKRALPVRRHVVLREDPREINRLVVRWQRATGVVGIRCRLPRPKHHRVPNDHFIDPVRGRGK